MNTWNPIYFGTKYVRDVPLTFPFGRGSPSTTVFVLWVDGIATQQDPLSLKQQIYNIKEELNEINYSVHICTNRFISKF